MSSLESFRIAVRKFGPFESAIARIWQSYQQTNAVTLTLEAHALDLNPLYDTLLARGGLKDGTWDVAFLPTDWLPEAVEEEAVLDLAPYMRREPIQDYPEGWAPSLTRFQHFGNAVYAVPYHDGPECFIYRRDLFEDEREQQEFASSAGYPLAPPRTWKQFYDIARFFTRPDQDLYGTVFAAYPDGHNSVYDFCLQLWSRDGDLLNDRGQVTLETPAAREALEFYRRIVRDPGATHPRPDEIDSVKSGEIFTEGKVAMMVNWFGFAAVCEQPDSRVKGKVAISEIPSADEGDGVSLSVYWTLAIGSGSRHKQAAYSFLRHACSPEMDKLTTLEGGIGCRLSTWNNPEVNRQIPFYHRLTELTSGARTLPRLRHFPVLAHLIDGMVQQAIHTDTPTEVLLREAQSRSVGIRL